MAIDRAAIVVYAREHNRRATFDGRIAELEQICRRDLPPSGVIPTSESRAWYAKEIVDAVGVVRLWLAQGQADIAAAEAVVVGMLAARAGARHHWPEVRRWSAHLETLRRGSQAGAQATRERAARRAAPLRAAVETCRRKHPGWSARAIAQALLATHGRKSGDPDKDLDALATRIRRLDREK